MAAWVNRKVFETEIQELKAKSKTKESEANVYVDDEIYTAAKK